MILLLVASAVLIALVTVGGYEHLAGATIVAVAYVIIYLLMAFFVARWSRGVLPMAAGMAILFTTFAAVAAPAWFARDKDGFTDPLMPAGLLGLLVLVVIAVQVLLILFAMRGFQQEWNIEVEVRDGDHGGYEDSGYESQGYGSQGYESQDYESQGYEDQGYEDQGTREHETYEGTSQDPQSQTYEGSPEDPRSQPPR